MTTIRTVVPAAWALAGFALAATVQEPVTRLRGLEIEDETGVVRARLGLSDAGDPGLWLYARDGSPRVALELDTAGHDPAVRLAFTDERGLRTVELLHQENEHHGAWQALRYSREGEDGPWPYLWLGADPLGGGGGLSITGHAGAGAHLGLAMHGLEPQLVLRAGREPGAEGFPPVRPAIRMIGEGEAGLDLAFDHDWRPGIAGTDVGGADLRFVSERAD